MSKKVVFLDRDGTIIEDKIYLNDPDQIEYLPGVFDSLKGLRDIGFEFVVVTNQSGIPRGLVDVDNLYEIHRRIKKAFSGHGIDFLEFYYAPYLVDSGHPFRKPSPGMLEAAAKDFNIDLKKSWMIGDRMTDVEAGHRVSAKTVFLTGTEDPKESPYAQPTFIAKSLMEAAEFILSN